MDTTRRRRGHRRRRSRKKQPERACEKQGRSTYTLGCGDAWYRRG